MTSRGTWPFERQDLVADRDAGALGRRPGRDSDDSRGRHMAPGYGVPARPAQPALAWTCRWHVDKVLLAAPRGLLRRRGDGDQGAGLDGAGLRAARVLLPRDRPQPAGGRPLPGARRGLRRRHRRGARRARRSCCRPTARRPRWSRRPGPSGGYVVDAVCPLVTKVHHEVKVRAGKGYQIVYVGHEGHEEAVGTMAVAPDAIHRVESVDEVDALPDVRRARWRCWPRPRSRHRDWAGVLDATRRALPRPVDARAAATCASPPPTASPR